MVLVKLLGLMDFFTLIAIFLIQYDILGWRQGFAFAVYLLLKGFYFVGDIYSAIDLLCGIYIILMIIGFSSTIISWIVIIYMIQKIFFSFSA